MNNKLPQITFIYDRRKTASPTRKASVEMRITYNYKQKWPSTGIMLYPHQWKNGKITGVTTPSASTVATLGSDVEYFTGIVEMVDALMVSVSPRAITVALLSNCR